MLHEHDATTPKSSRGVSRGGKPTAHVQAFTAANMDVIVICDDLEPEIEAILRSEAIEIRYCEKMSHELCASMRRTSKLHDRLEAIKRQRRLENIALCAGETIAS